MPSIHFSLNSLPPALRRQAALKLYGSITSNPQKPKRLSKHGSSPSPLPLKTNKPNKPTKPNTPNTTKKKAYLHPSLVHDIPVHHVYNSNKEAPSLSVRLDFSPSMLPTAQQKGSFVGKDNKIHFFTKSHIANAEKAFSALIAPFAHLTSQWGRVPIALTTLFAFPFTKNTPKSKTYDFAPMPERPDIDNINKAIIDCMTATHFFQDDSLVVAFKSAKCRTSLNPFLFFSIKNINNQFVFNLPLANNDISQKNETERNPLIPLPFLDLF